MTLKFATAMHLGALVLYGQGKLTREQRDGVIACAKDPNCETCQNCEAAAVLAGLDSGDLTADQAANPKAINWAALLAFVMQILQLLLPYIVPPAPTPTPSLPAGSGN